MFVVSLSYLVPLDVVDQLIPEHVSFLEKYYASGHFILSGRKEPRTGGVIIATVDSRSDLDRILADDPFFREKVASYDITEILPTKASEELSFLL